MLPAVPRELAESAHGGKDLVRHRRGRVDESKTRFRFWRSLSGAAAFEATAHEGEKRHRCVMRGFALGRR